jgi:hypothetical protein
MTSEPYKPFALLGGVTFTSAGDAGVADSGVADSGPGDAGADAADSSDADLDANDSPPVLTAITDPPYISPAGTSTQQYTLTGCTRCGAVTAVNLIGTGSPTVAPASSTSTTVTFVWPACTLNTIYGLQVVDANGNSNTLANSVYCGDSTFLYGWDEPVSYSGGVATDIVAGKVLNAFSDGGATAPGTGTVAGSHAVWTFNGTQALRSSTGFTSLPQPYSTWVLAQVATSSSGASEGLIDGIGSANRGVSYYFVNASTDAGATAIFGGTANVADTTHLLGTFTSVQGFFSGASSTVTVGGNAATSPSNAGTNALTGITLGAFYNMADPMLAGPGNVIQSAFVFNAALSGAAVTQLRAWSVARGAL